MFGFGAPSPNKFVAERQCLGLYVQHTLLLGHVKENHALLFIGHVSCRHCYGGHALYSPEKPGSPAAIAKFCVWEIPCCITFRVLQEISCSFLLSCQREDSGDSRVNLKCQTKKKS